MSRRSVNPCTFGSAGSTLNRIIKGSVLLKRVFLLATPMIALLSQAAQAAVTEIDCLFASYHCVFFWIISNFRFDSWTAYW